MTPVDPATAWRDLQSDGLQRGFAAPGGDTVGVFAQLTDLSGRCRQHRDVSIELPARVTFQQLLEQARSESAVAAAGPQPVDVAAQQTLQHCAERQQRRVGRRDVNHQSQRAPALETRLPIVDAAQGVGLQAQLTIKLGLQRRRLAEVDQGLALAGVE